MRPGILVPAAVMVAACLMVGTGRAEVVREDGTKSIAGALMYESPGAAFPKIAEWTFRSSGGEILFADLDAEIYRRPAGGEHETETSAAADDGCGDEGGGGSGEEGGCGGEEEEGGCGSEGGPVRFYIEVFGPADSVNPLCRAAKPAPPPGWMRDPRMACVLPDSRRPVTYILRVGLQGSRDDLVHPFLLNVSLRRIAPNGVNIQSAVSHSGTNGF